MDEEIKEKSKKIKIYRPSRFISFVLWLLSCIALFVLGFKVKCNNKELKKYKGGFILIGTHFTNIDYFFIGKAMKRKRISFVVTNHFSLQKSTRWAINIMNAITKEQFKNDITAIRKVRRVLENNGIVYIAPTGQITLTGTDDYISPSIVKLIKLGKVPVLAIKECGAHLCKPKWSTSKRRYPVNVNIETVLSKDDVLNMNEEDIYDRVKNALDVNDYVDQKKKMIPIKGKKIIEGLEGALYICPKCGKELMHNTHGNMMICEHCKNSVYMDKYGFIKPQSKSDKYFETVYEWYRYQKEVIKKKILSNDIEVSGDVVLRLYSDSKKDIIDAGFGKLVLNNDEFYYEGTEYGKSIRKDFDLEHIIQTPFSPHSHIEIPDNEKLYQFKPIDKKTKVISWVIVIDVMNELRTKNIIK